MRTNQFGLLGFWHPDNAPEPTPARRGGITAFFRDLRRELGSALVYWMDSYRPAEVEDTARAMDPVNYGYLDAIICSSFAVLAERTQIEPNVRSKIDLRSRLEQSPKVIFSFDFVDPWYWYRTYLDDRENFPVPAQGPRPHRPGVLRGDLLRQRHLRTPGPGRPAGRD